MNNELPQLTRPELEIMKVIWENTETSVNQVLESYNLNQQKKVKRNTIQTLLVRLEEKGWIVHREEGRAFYYKATRNRDETSIEIVKDIRDRVFDGSISELVKTLVDSRNINENDIDHLRNILDKYKQGSKSK